MTMSPQEYRRVVLELLPDQGDLSEEDYLWLTDHSRRPIEFTDGAIEVLPWPTRTHRCLLKFLLRLFKRLLNRQAASSSLLRCTCGYARRSSASRICYCGSMPPTHTTVTGTGPGPISSWRSSA